jgi:hypothetical protein
MSDSEALEFESLESDADKLRVRQAIQNNQSFSEGVKPLAGVDPKELLKSCTPKQSGTTGFSLARWGSSISVGSAAQKWVISSIYSRY